MTVAGWNLLFPLFNLFSLCSHPNQTHAKVRNTLPIPSPGRIEVEHNMACKRHHLVFCRFSKCPSAICSCSWILWFWVHVFLISQLPICVCNWSDINIHGSFFFNLTFLTLFLAFMFLRSIIHFDPTTPFFQFPS